ncbi:hypothetical protein Hanom_Chr06g00555231 [Helianthus anomalus]
MDLKDLYHVTFVMCGIGAEMMMGVMLLIFYCGEMRGDHSYAFLEWLFFITGFVYVKEGVSISRTLPCFEVSEMSMRSFVRTIANIWNEVGNVARILAEGSDWSLFFKVFTDFIYLIFNASFMLSSYNVFICSSAFCFLPLLLQVVISIYLFKLLVVNNFPTSMGVGMIFALFLIASC